MNDILSEVLTTLELESSLYFRAELSSPFSIAVPADRRVIRFHILSGGSCTIRVRGNDAIRFEHGDLVMVPHGKEHVLSDSAEQKPEPLSNVLESSFDGAGPLVFGGGGEPATLVCGHFSFSQPLLHPFLSTLPDMLIMRRDEGPGYVWIEQLLAFAEQESKGRPTGWHTIIDRLSQILLVFVLRSYIDAGDIESGAISALADQQLTRSLQAIHDAPEKSWSLDALAQTALMSRSAFVRKFKGACGIAPMRYLTHWRMQRARFLLKNGTHTAANVSSEVGYASEAAFNRAFKEHFETTPAAYARSTKSNRAP